MKRALFGLALIVSLMGIFGVGCGDGDDTSDAGDGAATSSNSTTDNTTGDTTGMDGANTSNGATSTSNGTSTSASNGTTGTSNGTSTSNSTTSNSNGTVDPLIDCGEPMEQSCDLPTPVGACDMSMFGFCVEYYAECLLDEPDLEASCTEGGGEFLRGVGCPAEDLLGACVDEDLASAAFFVYASGNVSTDMVATSCEEDGDAVFCAAQ